MADPQTLFPNAFGSLLAESAEPASSSIVGMPVAAGAIVALAVVAALGTWLLLPGPREIAVRRIGGVILSAATLIFSALLVRWTASQGGMGVFFWFFSAVALFSSIRVITHTKPVYSALYFVLTVFASAGLFVLMWAEFMAAALVLIYAGAILITYVFVIMLASEVKAVAGDVAAEHDAISRSPFLASAVGFAFAGLLVFLILDRGEIPKHMTQVTTSHVVSEASAPALGQELIENHAPSIQLAGIILTLAMVGAITLARRRVIVSDHDRRLAASDTLVTPGTPTDDNPHSIPVYGTTNPRQKAYPEN